MNTETNTISGLSGTNRNIGYFDKDECVSYSHLKHTMYFRLYPVASYTGVCANGPYERELNVRVYDHLKRYYGKSNFKVGRMRECHGMCPDGYSCKYFELPVIVRTTSRMQDQAVWIEHDIS